MTADRAKAIKTTATVNESPTDKLIRELREENAKLMEMLKKGGVPPEMMAAQGGDMGGDSDASKEGREATHSNFAMTLRAIDSSKTVKPSVLKAW